MLTIYLDDVKLAYKKVTLYSFEVFCHQKAHLAVNKNDHTH